MHVSRMPWRFVRNMLNNPKVIDEMSQSYPVRSLARFLIRFYKTAEHKLEQSGAPSARRAHSRFTALFKEEYQKALKSKDK
ncbi:hypothetical protein PRIPAC_94849 [Pristionchus pacificus]|uniref:Uncharacterized protein n=1 Tax=Pristionchus pacificus TaxID=54126 RepID=A0A2A6CI55_PRIPA|nr:hypothetical protein PRIPAC_94849 [Pristionchus pacificus]|eukprot:PDM77733.1 hypothetical protein PRIPAC_34600 [Pristionchus pacificus]